MKRLMVIMMSFIMMALNINVTYASEVEGSEPIAADSFSIEAEAAVLIDAQSGQVLYSKNMDERLEPASITKILTTYIACETLDLDDMLTASDEAIDDVPRYTSHIAIDYDEELSVRDLLYSIMLPSANDAANVVAEAVAGDLDSFADLMNQYVAGLGLQNTHFVNAHGLPDPDHYTSAYDMAMITRMAIKNETFSEIYSTRTYTTATTNKKDEPRVMANGNKMIQNGKYHYEYAIGGKTGYTDEARYTGVTVAEKDGLKLIAVLLKNSDEADRYEDMVNLFEYGFSNYADITLSKADVGTTTLDFPDQVQNFTLDDDIHILVTDAQRNSVLSHTIEYVDEDDEDNAKVILHLKMDNVEISTIELSKEVEMKEGIELDAMYIGYDSGYLPLDIINWFSVFVLAAFLAEMLKSNVLKRK